MKKIKGPSLEEMVHCIRRWKSYYTNCPPPRIVRIQEKEHGHWYIPNSLFACADFTITLDKRPLPLARRPMDEEEIANWHTALMIANDA